MSTSDLLVWLSRETAEYQPREDLEGGIRVQLAPDDSLDRLELSILWRTEGKGTEDIGVHHFQTYSPANGNPLIPGQSQDFRVTLPATPHSYDGLIVKIVWCVRVRLFFTGGGQKFKEIPFRVGSIVPACEVAKA